MSEKRYFAASNTSKGFASYFDENFRERADRRYIIKGGPGTGKSRLMREMADAFLQAGGEVEHYYCSSDPSSLDGIFIGFGNYTVAVMDGTAPHAEDISSPGTVDNLIDLGRFWNASELRLRKKEIEELTAKKAAGRLESLSLRGIKGLNAFSVTLPGKHSSSISNCAKGKVPVKTPWRKWGNPAMVVRKGP